MKAHITVDAATGLTEKVVTTAANEHDLNVADKLITAPVEVIFTDAWYRESCIKYVDAYLKGNNFSQ